MPTSKPVVPLSRDLAARIGRAVLHPGARADAALSTAQRLMSLIPIRTLNPSDKPAILSHLIALPPHDRYLRFGLPVGDVQIESYVANLDFERDEIFGITNRALKLVAMAHVAFAAQPGEDLGAEFGVSVAAECRGRGYGTLLFQRAVTHARNKSVGMMFIHALTENAAMLAIARKSGATVERYGSESEAHLLLPHPTLDSRVAEIVEDQVAQTDFHLKTQAKRFWDVLEAVQEVRAGVRRTHDGSVS